MTTSITRYFTQFEEGPALVFKGNLSDVQLNQICFWFKVKGFVAIDVQVCKARFAPKSAKAKLYPATVFRFQPTEKHQTYSDQMSNLYPAPAHPAIEWPSHPSDDDI